MLAGQNYLKKAASSTFLRPQYNSMTNMMVRAFSSAQAAPKRTDTFRVSINFKSDNKCSLLVQRPHRE